MQYLVTFTPKQKFETGGLPADYKERQLEELAQGQVLYAQGSPPGDDRQFPACQERLR